MTRKGLTRIDLAVALACIVLVAGQAAVINAGGRERSKRELCLANLRMLTAAWLIYSEDNAGNLVNGAPTNPGGPPPAGACPPPPAPGVGDQVTAVAPPSTSPFYQCHKDELPWIGPAYPFTGGTWVYGGLQNECLQKIAISTGALWKYTGDYNIYRCPSAENGACVTYMIIDSMNGKYMWNGSLVGNNTPSYMMAKNLSGIANASKRIVFLDVQRLMPDSYTVYSGAERWFDIPPLTHENGACVSFADGHSIFHKWNSQETINTAGKGLYAYQPVTCVGKNDLYWMQIACWGQLLYTPSCPVNLE
jgi:hypothetical protein